MSSGISAYLERRIERCYRTDKRITRGGYAIFFEGLEHTLARLPQRRHVTVAELVEGIHEVARREYGFLGETVLKEMGLHGPEDVSRGLQTLFDARLLIPGDEDVSPAAVTNYSTGVVRERALKDIEGVRIAYSFVTKAAPRAA